MLIEIQIYIFTQTRCEYQWQHCHITRMYSCWTFEHKPKNNHGNNRYRNLHYEWHTWNQPDLFSIDYVLFWFSYKSKNELADQVNKVFIFFFYMLFFCWCVFFLNVDPLNHFLKFVTLFLNTLSMKKNTKNLVNNFLVYL